MVGRQGKVKGHGGNGKSPVHLNLRGCHTGKTLEEEGKKMNRETKTQIIETERHRERGVQVTELGHWREGEKEKLDE